MKHVFKHAWDDLACWLPGWMVGWYWRGELRRIREQHRKFWEDPENLAKLKALPDAGHICRQCGHSWGKWKPGSEPCEHHQ